MSLVVNCTALHSGEFALWFEMTTLDGVDRASVMPDGVRPSVALHPFVWDPNPTRVDVATLLKEAPCEIEFDLRWLNLRLPILSFGIPRPAPTNWITISEQLQRRSGVGSFAVPAVVPRQPATISDVEELISYLIDSGARNPDAGVPNEAHFVGSPSLSAMMDVLRFSGSLLRAHRFVPAILPPSGRGSNGRAEWHTVLSPSNASLAVELAAAAPDEFYSELVGRRGEVGPPPMQRLHLLVDALVGASVRQLTQEHAPRVSQYTRDTKPLDSLAFSLTRRARIRQVTFSMRDRLGEVLDAWRVNALDRLEPAQLALRLSPPGYFETSLVEEASEQWEVALGLIAVEGDGVFIDSAAFEGAHSQLAALGLTPASAGLLYLRKLAAASKRSSEIETALASANPTRFHLGPEGVLPFVGGAARVLAEEDGVVLVLPSVLRDSMKPRITVSSAPHAAASNGVGLSSLFSFDVSVHLGDRLLDEAEIRRLVAAGTPVVKVDDEWIFVDTTGLGRALRFLERHQDRASMTLVQLLGDTANDRDLEDDLEIERPDPAVLVESLQRLRNEGHRIDVLPPGFKLALRDYQHRGVEWLASLESVGLGACLADDMGLGKTAQVIALLANEHARRALEPDSNGGGSTTTREMVLHTALPQPQVASHATLIVAPVSVVTNWRREIERFYPSLVVHIHHGSTRLDGVQLASMALSCDVVITSYSLLGRDIDLLNGVSWRRVVLDEAQNIKNPTTATARAAATLSAISRIALTGTPVENHTGELWAIMNFLNPGMLGTRASFRERFSIPIEREHDEGATRALGRIIAPFILRRLKTDRTIIADLPEKIELKEYCTLSVPQLTRYEAELVRLEANLANATRMERRGAILGSITRLKQICNHPGADPETGELRDESGKLERLEEILEEVLDSGQKAIIFTQFATFGAQLQRHLQERFAMRVLYLNGDVPMSRRDEMVTEFSTSSAVPLFILSLRAGGTGLNLTAANHVIHYDRWWNSAVEQQATDRAFRIGQRKDVIVTKLICEGTLEERIDAIIEGKRLLAENLISGGESWITEMSDEELFGLLALSTVG